MGNSCDNSNYLIEPNYHFIETNANYDRLNKIIEHISNYNETDKSKILSAIQNCRINQLPHNNEQDTSSNFSIKHGKVINDEDKVDINLSYISALDKTFTSRFNESSIFVDRSQSRKISKKISPIDQKKRKTVMNHLSNNNMFSKLELAKLQAKKQNLDDESVKSNKKKKKKLGVIKLLNTYKSNPNMLKTSISIKEKEDLIEKNKNLEVTNAENISVFATQIAKKKNEDKEIQEEFFSIAPTCDKEEESRKKEEALHKNNILEKLMQIISLDNNNKFVFKKTNLEKVNEFSIEGDQPKMQTHIVSDITSSRNSQRNHTGINSFRNQKTFSKQMSSSSPLLLRKGTSIMEKEINSKITERKKETKEFFHNVIFYSELKKVINITDRIIYATRFCVLTDSEFKCFKSKEEYIMVREPLLVISLDGIKNVNFVNMNRRGVQKNKNTHFGINYHKNTFNSSSVESMNYKRKISKIDEDVEVEFFGSADSKIIKRWIKEINTAKNIDE